MKSRPFISKVTRLRGGDGEWIGLAALLVAVEYVAALALSDAIGFRGRPPVFQYSVIQLVISLVGGSIIATPSIWRFWREGESRPIARLIRESDMSAVVAYLVAFQLLALQISALSWLKRMLPTALPYWADPLLAQMDHAIFGADAWRLIPEALIRPLDIIYICWAPVQMFVLAVILCLPPSHAKARAMLAYFMTWGLMGVCGQYLLSSAGPIFYDRIVGSDRFSGLLSRIDAHAEFVKIGANMLWTSYAAQTEQIGNGISAMPSMHVATATWLALGLTSIWPKTRLPAWAFWAAIFIGSFALGWHYWMDAVAGTIGALGCWVFARWLLVRRNAEVVARTLAPAG